MQFLRLDAYAVTQLPAKPCPLTLNVGAALRTRQVTSSTKIFGSSLLFFIVTGYLNDQVRRTTSLQHAFGDIGRSFNSYLTCQAIVPPSE